MEKVQRFEVITLDGRAALRLDNGMLKAPATLTRAGVFEYRNADGSTRRELRLPEEVFADPSVATFELTPLLDEHPYAEGGVVTSENAEKLTVGSVGSVRRNGMNLDATVMVTTKAAVDKVNSGKVALSCGYFCDRELKPGVWTDPAGKQHPYDIVQRNIRGNHVALVKVGRAGPEARIRLDSTDAELITTTIEKEETPMEKITLDGLTIEVTPAAAQVINKVQAMHATAIKAEQDKAAAVNSELEKTKAVLDSVQGELKTAQDPVRFASAVAARVSLETKARTFLPADTDLSKLDAKGIKAAVVGKLSTVNLDGKSDDYITGMYDHLTSKAEGKNAATEVTATEVKKATTEVTSDKADELSPEAKMRKAFFNPSETAK